MKLTQRLLLTVMLIGCAMMAIAQGGGMRMMGGAGGGGKLMLLRRDDVRDELKLSTTQKNQIDDLLEKMQEDMRDMFQGGGGDMDEIRKEVTKMRDKIEKEVMKLLDEKQAKRLQEINVQLAGNAAVLQADIAKEVGITSEQDTAIKKLQAEQTKLMSEMMEKMQGGGMDRDEMRSTMEKNRKDLNEKIGALLTEAQKNKLKEMGGAKFTPKDGGSI